MKLIKKEFNKYIFSKHLYLNIYLYTGLKVFWHCAGSPACGREEKKMWT